MIKMEGRNGLVNYRRHDIYSSYNGEYAFVDFYTRRTGKVPPIWFEGTNDELIALFSDIVDKLKKLKKEAT